MSKNFKSKEAEVTNYIDKIVVKNKLNGKTALAKRRPLSFTWECYESELQLYTDKDIHDQMELNEEGEGRCFHLGLLGYSNEELRAELEERKTRPGRHKEDDSDKMIAYMLKVVGLPTMATLRKHKRSEEK